MSFGFLKIGNMYETDVTLSPGDDSEGELQVILRTPRVPCYACSTCSGRLSRLG